MLKKQNVFWKLPTAWLQLRYQKIRLLVALLGVVFAVVIIFMQLGIRDALFNSSVRFHEELQGDCFLISPRSNALIAMESLTERRLSQTLALPEVEFVSPIYVSFVQWRNPQEKNYWRKIFIIGFDLRHKIFNLPGVQEKTDQLKFPDRVLFDRNSRFEFGDIVSEFRHHDSVVTQVSNNGVNRKIQVVGLFQLGTSFGADGNLITSHLNFLRIFRNRSKSLIDIGLIKLKPDTDVNKFVNKLQSYLPQDVKVLSKQDFIKFEQNYWNSSTPIGFIFSLGVILGLVVGTVIVYQILYTNVSEHLSEYATLKAIGYRHNYLLSIVLQQATFIAILGYIPGFLISAILYEVAKKATLLPFNMNFERSFLILFLTVIMCLISGVLAIKRLKAADPADIF